MTGQGTLEVDTRRCCGSGMCVLSAPDVFDQDDHGIVVVLVADPTGGHLGAVAEAVRLCPSGALRLRGASGAAVGP